MCGENPSDKNRDHLAVVSAQLPKQKGKYMQTILSSYVIVKRQPHVPVVDIAAGQKQ